LVKKVKLTIQQFPAKEAQMQEQEPKLGWKTLTLTDEMVAAHLATQLDCHGTVMLDFSSRLGRRHLRIHKDGAGYFVRCGRRGSMKQYLGRCKVTYLDGEPTLFAFTRADRDAFDADQQQRWEKKHGVS
jgi:hypothetical protein